MGLRRRNNTRGKSRQEKLAARKEKREAKKEVRQSRREERQEKRAERKEERKEKREERRETRRENRQNVLDNIRGRVGNTVNSVRDRIQNVFGNAVDRISGTTRNIRDNIIGFIDPTPIPPFDPTAIIRETEEEVTDAILEAADDIAEANNDTLIKAIDQATPKVLEQIEEISPNAADLFEDDFEVAKEAIDNISDIIEQLITDPKAIDRQDFVDLITENTEILTSTSEYVLGIIREQIPRDSLLQDVFDAIETTNTERGLTTTKLVFMMGATPEEEEDTRDAFVEELEAEVDSLIDEINLLSTKTPIPQEEINEIDAEVEAKERIIDALDNPTALDLYTDLIDGVDSELAQQLYIALDNSDSNFVEPEIITVDTEIPKKRKLNFILNQPEPNIPEDLDEVVERDIRKKWKQFDRVSRRLVPEERKANKPLVKKQQKLNEDAMIKRILGRTRLDEKLEKTYRAIDKKRTGEVVISPDTRDKLRISKLEDDLSDKAMEDKILERLKENTPTYIDLMEQAEEQMKKDQTAEKPLNLDITRNEQGFILSDEVVEEGLLTIPLVDKKMMSAVTVENVIDIDFIETELPFVEENQVEKLEAEIAKLKEEIIDLEGETEELETDKVSQREEINTKESTIESLQQQIVDLNERFAVTPSEGTIFSIPWVYPNANKEDLDYWIIENGERRRIKNYAMAQLMCDQRKKTILDILPVEASNIRKIKEGTPVTVQEAAGGFWKVQKAANINLYVPDQVLEGGKLKVLFTTLQGPINEHLRIGRIMDWMYNIGSKTGDKRWKISELSTDEFTVYQSFDRDTRTFLAKSAIYQASKQVNIEANAAAAAKLKVEEDAKKRKEAVDKTIEEFKTKKERRQELREDRKADRKENREDRKADRKERREDRKADRQDRRDNRQDRREARKDLKGKEKRDQRKEDRKQNRAERQEDRKENKAERKADRKENKTERKADRKENKAERKENRKKNKENRKKRREKRKKKRKNK